MKIKLMLILLILSALLTACDYVVVEDSDKITIGSILIGSAAAEEAADDTEDAISNRTEKDENETGPGERANVILSGMRGEEVKTLQTLLARYGFMTGRADGIFGAQTETGVKNAQEYKEIEDREKEEKERNSLMQALKEAAGKAALNLCALTITEDESASPTEADFIFVSIFQNDPEIETEDKPLPGVCDETLLKYLEEEFSVYKEDMKKGSSGEGVKRLQRRLNHMNYLPGGVDGRFGQDTNAAVKYFQRLNGLKETGVADEKTQRMLFSDECQKAEVPVYPYRVEISISKQKVYVYKWHFGSYSKLVKTMTCTTGTTETPTPLGSFKMGGPCGRWYYFKKFDCWAQYASRITGGILFHSVIYSEKDEATLRQSTVNALGTRASHGCVRLSVENARWIYENISPGTTCRVYN